MLQIAAHEVAHLRGQQQHPHLTPGTTSTMLQMKPMLQMAAHDVAHLRGQQQHPHLTPGTTSTMLQMEPMLQMAAHEVAHLRGQQQHLHLTPRTTSTMLQMEMHKVKQLHGQQDHRPAPGTTSLLETESSTCGGSACSDLRREGAAFRSKAGAIDAAISSAAFCLQEAKDMLYHAMSNLFSLPTAFVQMRLQ